MLTTYLDHLQHASAGAQIAGCLLGAIAIFIVCFGPGLVSDHAAAYRASR